MSVHKRGKYWSFRIRVFDEVKNTYINKRIGRFDTKNEAKKAEAKYMANIEKAPTSSTTLNQVFSLYVKDKERKIKDTSIYDINKKYRLHIEPTLGSLRIHKIDKHAVKKYQDYLLEKDYKNSQLKNLQTLLNAIIKFAIKHELIERNPFDIMGYVTNNEPQEEMKFLTYDEYSIFEKELTSKYDKDVYTDALITLYWTGMRCGELQSLTWNDFRGDCLFIHSTYDNKLKKVSETTKTRKNRYVYLNDSVIKVINNRKKWSMQFSDFDHNKYIFGYYDVFSHKSISNKKNLVIETFNNSHDQKLPTIRIHDLRHSHASLLIDMGWSSFEVANRLGNTPSQIERTYAHMFKSTQINIAKSLNDFEHKKNKNKKSVPTLSKNVPTPQKKPLFKG